MSSTLTLRRIMKEFENIRKHPNPNIIALPTPSNIFNWHFIIYGLKDCPFEGGFYHGKLILPSEYPQKPPHFMFVTPNGRFKPMEKICTSFSNYHPESWAPSWNIEKMLMALLSFMNSDEMGAGGMQSSDSKKKSLAKYSLIYNLKNPEFVGMFKPFFDQIGIDVNLLQPQKLQELELKYQTDVNTSEFNSKNINIIVIFGLAVAIFIYYFYQD